MNRIIRYLLLSGTVAVMTASCTYLDKQPDNLRTSDQIWQTRDDAEAFLNQVYSYIWYNLDDFVGLGVADETSLPMTGLNARQLIEGQWTASNYLWNNWTPSYNAIRTALEFEANIDRVPDDRISPELKATYKCESKFLRGWFYWKLLQMYGPFIKVEEPISTGADFASYQRAPFDECVEYVCQLLTEAASGLEDKRMVAMEYGRPTKAACLAVIAQVRLLAASELWNGNPDFANFRNHDGTLLAPQTYDAHKWERMPPGPSSSWMHTSSTTTPRTELPIPIFRSATFSSSGTTRSSSPRTVPTGRAVMMSAARQVREATRCRMPPRTLSMPSTCGTRPE